MSTNSRQLFGRVLVREVRDRAIRRIRSLVTGNLKSEAGRAFLAELSQHSARDTQLLMMIAQESVDTTLHYLLALLDEDEFEVLVEGRGITGADALVGELYGEIGWISKFSVEDRASEGN